MVAHEAEQPGTRCPACGGRHTRRTRRGYAGQADTANQYITCSDCGATTYEIISRTNRELRVDRLEPGRRFKHQGSEYIVSRILKVGLDEALVYVRPAPPHPSTRIG
jgi:DNA-directed RNA polymerase subunit RPC12/RpoP